MRWLIIFFMLTLACNNHAKSDPIDIAKGLSPENKKKVVTYIYKLERQEQYQAQARRWLIALAVVSGLPLLIALGSKFLSTNPVGTILSWIASRIRARVVVTSTIVCAASILGAVYIVPIWSLFLPVLIMVLTAVGVVLEWEIATHWTRTTP